MHRIKIRTPQGRSLLIMGGDLNDLPDLLPEGRLFIITDTNVRGLYGDRFPEAEVLTIQPGEESKNLSVAGDICRKLLETGAERSSFILGFGGGVVCDIAGLVASVFMRGVRHGFVSTTLLSQVDASIGGKTGVNIGQWKNMIGTFRQPEFVLCDHNMLSTLSDDEFQSGMGELIKHALIGDREMFCDISGSLDRLYERDPVMLEDMIFRAVKIKARIVARDPYEKNARRVLNFGHTFGHVLETYYSIPHGIAVMEGMLIAAGLSVWAGELPASELHMIQKALEMAGLTSKHELPPNVISLISKDKKGEVGSINFVLLRSAGRAVIRKLPLDEIETFVKFYREKESGK
jgi:3-dehydroquinate synthase